VLKKVEKTTRRRRRRRRRKQKKKNQGTYGGYQKRPKKVCFQKFKITQSEKSTTPKRAPLVLLT
jgi:hypothetical protein